MGKRDRERRVAIVHRGQLPFRETMRYKELGWAIERFRESFGDANLNKFLLRAMEPEVGQ